MAIALRNLNFAKWSISQFLNELGSDAPCPGGGSAAALTGAVGVSLLEMTARINLKRALKKNRLTIIRIQSLRSKLIKLASLDARAFMKISKLFKSKRESVEFQRALLQGAKVPYEICGRSCEALKFCLAEKSKTSAWLLSDLKEAGMLLRAAFSAGRLNVEINLKEMRDKKQVLRFETGLGRLAKECASLHAKLVGVSGE